MGEERTGRTKQGDDLILVLSTPQSFTFQQCRHLDTVFQAVSDPQDSQQCLRVKRGPAVTVQYSKKWSGKKDSDVLALLDIVHTKTA